MAKPFKFRHVNEIAGAFVGIVVLMLIAGIVLAARAQKWFREITPISVEMPQGASGVKDGAEVHMMGTTVGTVDEVQPDDNGHMSALLRIDSKFARFIHADDKAVIHVPLALADPFIEIVLNKENKTALDSKQSLIAEPESGAADALNRTVDDVRTQTLPAVLSLLHEYSQLAVELRDPHSSLQETLARFDRISAKMESNDNLIGRLFNDKGLADTLAQSVQKLSASTDDLHVLIENLSKTAAELPKIAQGASSQMDQLPAVVHQTQLMMEEVTKALHDLQQTTSQLPAVVGSLRQSIDQLPDVMAHAQQTLVEVQKLTRAMQDLPLIRDSVEHSPKDGALQPADIGGMP